MHLRGRHFRLHGYASCIQLDYWPMTGLEPSVALRCCVVEVGISERVLRPSESACAILNCVENHLGVLDSRKVKVFSEVIDHLLHADMVSTPQRNLVDFEAKDCTRHAGDQQAIVLEVLGSPFRQPLLSLKPELLPLDRWEGLTRFWALLPGDKQPDIGFWN